MNNVLVTYATCLCGFLDIIIHSHIMKKQRQFWTMGVLSSMKYATFVPWVFFFCLCNQSSKFTATSLYMHIFAFEFKLITSIIKWLRARALNLLAGQLYFKRLITVCPLSALYQKRWFGPWFVLSYVSCAEIRSVANEPAIHIA